MSETTRPSPGTATIEAGTDPLVTALEAALDATVAWRKPAYLSDTVQSMVAAGQYRDAAVIVAARLRSFGIVHEAEARAALLGEVREGVERMPATWRGHGLTLNKEAVLALLDTLSDGGPTDG